MSIQIISAFVAMRKFIISNEEEDNLNKRIIGNLNKVKM